MTTNAPAAPPASAPKRMAPTRRREHLIDVAASLYATVPFDQVSVDDITEAAGVSRALFYRYFAGPREIFVATTQVIVDGLLTHFHNVPHDMPLLEQLRQALTTFMDLAQEYSQCYIALMRNPSVQTTTGAGTIIDEVRAESVREMQDRLGIPEAPRIVQVTLKSWLLVVENTVLEWLSSDDLPREGLDDLLIAQLLGMGLATADLEPEVSARIMSALSS